MSTATVPRRVRRASFLPLPRVWDKVPDRHDSRGTGGVLYAGWSKSEGRFKGFVHRSADGFQGVPAEDHHVVAAPWVRGTQPVALHGDWARSMVEQYERWALVPRYGGGGKVLVGGDVFLTILTADAQEQRKIQRFSKDTWQFRKMMIGAAHECGQLGPQ